jgi:YidC/Oxa1 family membrane protein insertase
MNLTLTTRGGALKSLQLKHYSRNQQGLTRLIPEIGPDSLYPLETTAGGEEGPSPVLFHVDKKSLQLGQAAKTGSLRFIGTAPDGGTISKVFTFYNDSYQIDVDVETNGRGPSSTEGERWMAFTWSLWQGVDSDIVSKRFPEPVYRFFKIFVPSLSNESTAVKDINYIQLVSSVRKNNANSLKRYSVTKPFSFLGLGSTPVWLQMGKSVDFTEEVNWIALNDKYFAVALLPRKGKSRAGDGLKSEVSFEQIENNKIRTTLGVKPYTAGIDGETYGLKIYAGPKDYSLLRSLGAGLEKTVDFGFFGIISVAMLLSLKFLNGLMHNYGVAIIILTAVIKVILYPLTYSSMASMKKMQALQPEMAAIREKYKNDSSKMNKEMMELYRKRGLNPLGGCLPLILQMPIFFAFYTTLQNAVELRGAGFLWMADLSEKDPLYVLPILMGVSMFAQQKMTPAQDPRMQMLTYLMPVIFTVMFFNFPSGLVLYWLISNVLQIGQQYYMTKTTKSDQTKEIKEDDSSKPQKVEKKEVAAVDNSNRVKTILARRRRRKRG